MKKEHILANYVQRAWPANVTVRCDVWLSGVSAISMALIKLINIVVFA